MKAHKTIILTRPKSTADELSIGLQEQGFTILSFPTIEISFLNPDFNSDQLNDFTHLIFTSQNGAIGFFYLIGKAPIPPSCKIVTIGKKTAKTVEEHGYQSHTISNRNTAEDLAKELRNQHLKDSDSVLLSVGRKAGSVIEQTLQGFCKTTRIEVYDTLQPRTFAHDILDRIKKGTFDLIVFTSPSTFENFIAITGLIPQALNGRIACIGTTTGEKVIESGYQPSLIASSADAKTFTSEITGFLTK